MERPECCKLQQSFICLPLRVAQHSGCSAANMFHTWSGEPFPGSLMMLLMADPATAVCGTQKNNSPAECQNRAARLYSLLLTASDICICREAFKFQMLNF